jgi:hypothetical protein
LIVFSVLKPVGQASLRPFAQYQHALRGIRRARRLCRGLRPAGPAIARAVNHLVEQQQSDGSWEEKEFTGTGFPCVFYLKYHLYRNYFPLYALSRFRNVATRITQFCGLTVRPQEFDRQNARRMN